MQEFNRTTNQSKLWCKRWKNTQNEKNVKKKVQRPWKEKDIMLTRVIVIETQDTDREQLFMRKKDEKGRGKEVYI